MMNGKKMQGQDEGLLAQSMSESELIPELESVPVSQEDPYMHLSDEELQELADAGMGPLREYAAMFGVKGVAKQQIIDGLKALRT